MQIDKTIERSILALRTLCILVVIAQATETIIEFNGDTPLVLIMDNQIWSKPLSEFSMLDKIAILGISELFTMAWLFVIYQFWALCDLYSKGEVFTRANARKFHFMSVGLILMSLGKTISDPLLGYFLASRGILEAQPDFDPATMIDINFLTAGVVFCLIAKIMERASLLQQDADLTV